MGLCALYSRKIKQIAEYYRAKRNETSLIVKKNVQKGTLKSIQEIIYEKIFDYLFSDRNIVASYENIKRDLIVSVENYVDTYSDYFDIPRE
jgi:stalled ribosome rescue protein Dom34